MSRARNHPRTKKRSFWGVFCFAIVNLLFVVYCGDNMKPPIAKITEEKNENLPPMTQAEFLVEHNRLSPANLRADSALLARFRQERQSLFTEDGWSLEKLRRPFIIWLTALPERRGDGCDEVMVNNQKYSKFS